MGANENGRSAPKGMAGVPPTGRSDRREGGGRITTSTSISSLRRSSRRPYPLVQYRPRQGVDEHPLRPRLQQGLACLLGRSP